MFFFPLKYTSAHAPNVIALIFLSIFAACSQTQTFLLQYPLTVKNICFHSQHLKTKTDTQPLNETAHRSENIVLIQNSYSLSCLFPERYYISLYFRMILCLAKFKYGKIPLNLSYVSSLHYIIGGVSTEGAPSPLDKNEQTASVSLLKITSVSRSK